MLRPDTTLEVLPRDQDATFVVETLGSSYIVRPVQMTAERWPVAPGAAKLPHDGEPISYTSIYCVLGEPLVINYEATELKPVPWCRHATEVESICLAWTNDWAKS